MILYLDTSSLLKCLIDEAHTADVLEWVEAASAVATSRVTFPEAAAALARRRRLGDLTDEAGRVALGRLAERWGGFMLVDIAEVRAGGLATRHDLRGFDAVQLAAALTLRSAVGARDIAFSAFDRALCQAARREGLIVLEPGGRGSEGNHR
jgi:predicted nucleic acid-binding protein